MHWVWWQRRDPKLGTSGGMKKAWNKRCWKQCQWKSGFIADEKMPRKCPFSETEKQRTMKVCVPYRMLYIHQMLSLKIKVSSDPCLQMSQQIAQNIKRQYMEFKWDASWRPTERLQSQTWPLPRLFFISSSVLNQCSLLFPPLELKCVNVEVRGGNFTKKQNYFFPNSQGKESLCKEKLVMCGKYAEWLPKPTPTYMYICSIYICVCVCVFTTEIF